MKKKKILSAEEVRKVAKLANLNLSQRDLKNLRKQFSDIVELVGKMQKVQTKNIPPTSQVTGLYNVFREDEIQPSLTREETLANAPRKEKGYFVVKNIFEQ